MEAHDQVVSELEAHPAIVPETIGPAIVPENIEPAIVPEQCITFVALHNMDQLEELRGCDKRLAACMLD